MPGLSGIRDLPARAGRAWEGVRSRGGAGCQRFLTEYLGAVLIITMMALWVRANRAALAVADNTSDGEKTWGNPADYSHRLSAVRWLSFSAIEPGQNPPPQARPAEAENVRCSG